MIERGVINKTQYDFKSVHFECMREKSTLVDLFSLSNNMFSKDD